jgi:hypothetical protein
MAKALSKDKRKGLADEFGLDQKEVQKIYDWMQEHVDEYDQVGKLADAAAMEFDDIVGEDDDDLCYELAFMFESVVG